MPKYWGDLTTVEKMDVMRQVCLRYVETIKRFEDREEIAAKLREWRTNLTDIGESNE